MLSFQMISSLSFEQDNKIEDQPVSDLLTYLNAMLDTAVARARTPSGQNPLQQLILIISDGKFHEKVTILSSVLAAARIPPFLLGSEVGSLLGKLEAAC
jgi:midasin